MVEAGSEFLEIGEGQSPERPRLNPYFDQELRAAARGLLAWGDPSQRQENEANYLAVTAKRGLSPQAARDLLPILNSGRMPPTKPK